MGKEGGCFAETAAVLAFLTFEFIFAERKDIRSYFGPEGQRRDEGIVQISVPDRAESRLMVEVEEGVIDAAGV